MSTASQPKEVAKMAFIMKLSSNLVQKLERADFRSARRALIRLVGACGSGKKAMARARHMRRNRFLAGIAAAKGAA